MRHRINDIETEAGQRLFWPVRRRHLIEEKCKGTERNGYGGTRVRKSIEKQMDIRIEKQNDTINEETNNEMSQK